MSRLSVKNGGFQIELEGEEKWISEMYQNLLDDLRNDNLPQPLENSKTESQTSNKPVSTVTLPTFLNQKSALKSQNRKFLATAVWLHEKGKNKLSVSDVTAALSQYNQGRLGNPSDVLAQNVGKGYCEKEGKEFYVTPEGMSSLEAAD